MDKNKEYQMILWQVIDLLKEILSGRAGMRAHEYYSASIQMKSLVLGGNKETRAMMDTAENLMTQAHKMLFC